MDEQNTSLIPYAPPKYFVGQLVRVALLGKPYEGTVNAVARRERYSWEDQSVEGWSYTVDLTDFRISKLDKDRIGGSHIRFSEAEIIVA
jgi:hypothetical protein